MQDITYSMIWDPIPALASVLPGEPPAAAPRRVPGQRLLEAAVGSNECSSAALEALMHIISGHVMHVTDDLG
jgi:hypothetical protein